MTDSGFIVDLNDLEEALPRLRTAVEEIHQVISTVGAALDGLDEVVSPAQKGTYASEAYAQQVQAIADALDRTLQDLYPVLVPNPDIPIWPGHGPLPDGDPDGDDDTPDDDVPVPWPGDKNSKKEEKKQDEDKEQEDKPHHPPPPPPVDPGPPPVPTAEEKPVPPPGEAPPGKPDSAPVPENAPGPTAETPEEEEATEEERGFERPGYISAANRPLLDELENKEKLLEDTRARLSELESTRASKAEVLERLQAAVAAKRDPALEERIDLLKKEITNIDIELWESQELIPELEAEIEALQKRLELVMPGPDADIDAIRALEGAESAQWIKDHTYDCVHYIVERMAIPPELPMNAHLWDEQATKFAAKYGMRIGDVPLEGSVIIMEREHSYASEIYGHVMYVEKVEDGIVWVTDNNYPDRLVRLDHLTTELSGPYIKYLYLPWETKV